MHTYRVRTSDCSVICHGVETGKMTLLGVNVRRRVALVHRAASSCSIGRMGMRAVSPARLLVLQFEEPKVNDGDLTFRASMFADIEAGTSPGRAVDASEQLLAAIKLLGGKASP